MKITVFDTETTGLFPKDYDNIDECPYMLQLSSITYDTSSNDITNEIDSIVKISPEIRITDEVAKLNHITNEITEKNGVAIKPLLEAFNYQMKISEVVIGHNLEFDLNIIQYECKRHNVPFE